MIKVETFFDSEQQKPVNAVFITSANGEGIVTVPLPPKHAISFAKKIIAEAKAVKAARGTDREKAAVAKKAASKAVRRVIKRDENADFESPGLFLTRDGLDVHLRHRLNEDTMFGTVDGRGNFMWRNGYIAEPELPHPYDLMVRKK